MFLSSLLYNLQQIMRQDEKLAGTNVFYIYISSAFLDYEDLK